jgi:hypothetical protein
MLQTTPADAGSFSTPAENSTVPDTWISTEAGLTLTEISGGGTMLIVTVADLLLSATEIAVTVAAAIAGTLAGAV